MSALARARAQLRNSPKVGDQQARVDATRPQFGCKYQFLNYVADTLMFCGAVLLLAGAI